MKSATVMRNNLQVYSTKKIKQVLEHTKECNAIYIYMYIHPYIWKVGPYAFGITGVSPEHPHIFAHVIPAI